MTTITVFLGYLFILSAIVVGVVNVAQGGFRVFQVAGLVSVCVLQLAVGCFLIYASIQRKNGTLLSAKVYPSSIAAAILSVAFSYRWFEYGV
ncbi:hypothetical protein [Teredinibacter purpureus]|uniref:hypothetical protein n=1 Tax=Teredinibacter purpureus TaxID=2731756 RepID=UPI0005F77861|nr:hypothetical protein [Teredinibacter purpureus]